MSIKQAIGIVFVSVSLVMLTLSQGFRLGYMIKAETVRKAISYEISE